MGIQGITKLLANSKTWQSLTRSEVGLEELAQFGKEIPKEVAFATKITGKYHNGSLAEFILFKDQKGKSLGSISLFPNGKRIEIDMKRSETYRDDYWDVKHFCEDATDEYCAYPFNFTNLSITKKVFKNNTPIKEHKSFSQVCKSESKQRIYQYATRTSRTPNVDGSIDYLQEVVQIKIGKNPYRKSMKSECQITKDGEVTLKNLEQMGVNMDTRNPYFLTIFMEPFDFIRATYANIVKRRGLNGIEPPLLFSHEKFVGKYEQAEGLAPSDNSFIAIRPSNSSKYGFVEILGHECEHLFTQHANIHLAGIHNLKSDNPISIKFYDGLMERFKPIQKGTAKYNKAKLYAEESKNYNKTVWDENERIQIKEHDDLCCEIAADKAGAREEKQLRKCENDFRKNFSLFTLDYFKYI